MALEITATLRRWPRVRVYSDSRELYYQMGLQVKQYNLKADDDVWVLRDSKKVLDYRHVRVPNNILYQKTTLRELEKELQSNIRDLNNGRQ